MMVNEMGKRKVRKCLSCFIFVLILSRCFTTNVNAMTYSPDVEILSVEEADRMNRVADEIANEYSELLTNGSGNEDEILAKMQNCDMEIVPQSDIESIAGKNVSIDSATTYSIPSLPASTSNVQWVKRIYYVQIQEKYIN